jgi:hypothetical protein
MESRMTTLTVTPGYGRDYKSAKAVKADWAAGKDFVIANLSYPTYINKRDADRYGVEVWLRYDSLSKKVRV